MTYEMIVVIGIAVAAIAGFVSERLPIDQISILVPVALVAFGVLHIDAALSGLSNPATSTVAAMLVLGMGLQKTGVTRAMARLAKRAPVSSPRGRLLFLCLVVAAVSPFLGNVAVVSMFIPLFVAVAEDAGQKPSQVLIPLSFTAVLGGTVTLIGTTTNLVVQNLAKNRGYGELHVFSIAPLGLVYLAVGMAYLFTVGRWLMPERDSEVVGLAERYQRREFVAELTVTRRSPALGQVASELDWEQRYSLSAVEPAEPWYRWSSTTPRPLSPGDRLVARGRPEALLECARAERLETSAEAISPGATGPVVELAVAPASRLIGSKLDELGLLERYGAVVLGIQRRQLALPRQVRNTRLAAGDLLMVQGSRAALEAIAEDLAFTPLGEVSIPDPSRPPAPVAAGVLAAVVIIAALNLTSLTAAAIAGAVAMIYLRCVRLDEIYRELDWNILVLLVGLLPLGVAMDQSGLAKAIGFGVGSTVGHLGPIVTVGAFYLLTSLLTELMSNQAAAVVLTPIALTTAAQSQMNPYALVVAVMFGASASFMTPTGYQTNTLVYAPGGYRFTDFLRVGGPLNLILTVVAAVSIPVLFP